MFVHEDNRRMTIDQMIAALELVKHDHYTDREGLHDCEVACGRGPCDCGALEANILIDSVIEELKRIEESRVCA